MAVRQPNTREIGGMHCLNKTLAMERVGMKKDAFNKLIAMTKAKDPRLVVPIPYYQTAKGAPMWFPEEQLDVFVTEVMKKGCAFRPRR